MRERVLLAGIILALAACSPPRGPVAAPAAFASGDECLFCHREKVGAGWEREAHNLTIRRALGDEPEREARYLLGKGAHARFLKEAGFGRLSLRSKGEPPAWDDERFGAACAGCHATAVDPATRRFEAVSLDCFVCHGNPPRGHTERPEEAVLSPRRDDPARVVTAVCAQCHLRGGRSRRSGLPYPHPGSDLFLDFEVDFSDAALARVSSADRHVMENVRAVLGGDERTTCLSCHAIHRPSHAKHQRVPEGESCYTCHVRGAPMKERRPFTRGSPVCEY